MIFTRDRARDRAFPCLNDDEWDRRRILLRDRSQPRAGDVGRLTVC